MAQVRDPAQALAPREDHRVYLHGVSWADFEKLLAIRGDVAGPRVTYWEGELELMSPSSHHERIKTLIGRLLEAYAEETGLALNGYGAWTLKDEPRERAVEPDECYVLGTEERTPDIAIEVIWTHGGMDKLPVYAGLGVREVWVWERGTIAVYRLRRGSYEPIRKSEVLPDLDVETLASFVERQDQTAAVRDYRKTLRR
jgi:Uma2 family endonuclease